MPTEEFDEYLEAESDGTTTSLIAELEKLEISATEARIFLFLSRTGPCSASDIARGTKVPRSDTYRHIGSLLARGLLTSTFTKPQKYTALSFEDAIDLLVKTKYETLSAILQRKRELQSKLTAICRANPRLDEQSNEFQVLEDKEVIHSKIKKMFVEAESTVLAKIGKRTMINFYHAEICDEMISLEKHNVAVKIKTDWHGIYDYLREIYPNGKLADVSDIVSDTLDFDFVIIDRNEAIILMYEEEEKKLRGLYINSNKMTPAFELLFERLR